MYIYRERAMGGQPAPSKRCESNHSAAPGVAWGVGGRMRGTNLGSTRGN